MGRYLKIPEGQDCLKVMALPDIHIPHNIDLSGVEEFMAWFKPDYLLYLGDFLNLDCVSHWLEDKRRPIEGQRLLIEYATGNNIITRHRNIVGDAKIIYFMGNHENWVQQYLDKFPQFEGLIEVEKYLEGVDKYIPFNELWSIGKLHYMHGVYVNQYHAAKTVNEYGVNLIYGHTHDVQEFTKCTPQDKHAKKAKSIGCLCKFDLPYMKKRPSRWVNAFNIAYVRKNGHYNEYTINITDGHFSYCGRNY